MGENKFHTQMGISKIGEKGYSINAVSWNHLFHKKYLLTPSIIFSSLNRTILIVEYKLILLGESMFPPLEGD